MTRLILLLIALTQSVWTSKCSGTVCVFDGAKSIGTISAYSWNFGDGSPLSSGVQVGHTFAQPGIYDVRLTVTDAATKKTYYSTHHLTVTAANVITRVDTVRVPSKPDTIRRVDTLIRHDTVLYTIPGAASFGSYAADTSRVQGAPVGRVWRMELVGTIDTLGRRFRMFSVPTVLTTGPLLLTALSVFGTAENLTSAITLLVRADSARRAGP